MPKGSNESSKFRSEGGKMYGVNIGCLAGVTEEELARIPITFVGGGDDTFAPPQEPTSRRLDQPPNGGGNYFSYSLSRPPRAYSWWRPIDERGV